MSISVSFEFFPPPEVSLQSQLWNSIRRLALLAPRFVSVTYGADGSTRDRTHGLVRQIQASTGLCAVPHLTCVGATRSEVLDLAQTYWKGGIRHIVALRGDPPQASKCHVLHPAGFANAAALVAGLRSVAPFEVSVAAYPETHPEAESPETDIDALKAKIDAGATRALSQFFYDTDRFLRFRDRCASRGISVPIVPGILPITRFPQVLRMADRCRTRVPEWLCERFAGLESDPDTQQLLAASVAIEQVLTLRRHGVSEFHFYTLNQATLTYAVCYALGLRPTAAVQHS